jgi:uncharacterized protein YecA (UPF0149 family)
MKEVSKLLEILDSEFGELCASLPCIRFNDSRIPNRIKEAPIHQRAKYEGTGRNAPCPCGSGSKYKKCCITQPLDATNDQP